MLKKISKETPVLPYPVSIFMKYPTLNFSLLFKNSTASRFSTVRFSWSSSAKEFMVSISRILTGNATVISFQSSLAKYSAIFKDDTVILFTPTCLNHFPIIRDW